ncbi:MAG: cytochrome b/b6 domain-containing protein [Alphaproteobacteria bacterium]|nr:cytochrome b/b6 domain-containing protein [Alphaproteobacteria bacterium]MCB9975245.1 cytochrome b/b6 domain-containing protein [Rhodospirillales bacterium]
MKNTHDSYGFVLKFLHWITALIIMGLLFAGFIMAGMALGEPKLKIYLLHKSFGLLVLLLVIVRVFWRIFTPKVSPLDSHRGWEKILAKITHVFLYFALFAMPLSGWIMSSAGEFPVTFFGLPVPSLSEKNPTLFDFMRGFHAFMAMALIGIIGLHLAGALKHHVIDRDRTMMRMMNSRNYTFTGGLVVGLFFAALLGGNALLAISKELIEQDEARTSGAVEAGSVPEHESAEAKEKYLPNQWFIVNDESVLGFEAMQYGQAFSGTFDFSGQIIFDPENLEGNSVSITIDITSIDTGSKDRDGQAQSFDWFDTERYPTAFFEAKSFIKGEANHYTAKGNLVIRDVRMPIELPFELAIERKGGLRVAHVKAQTILMRLDFKVGQGQWESTETIGNEVKISLTLVAGQHAGQAEE